MPFDVLRTPSAFLHNRLGIDICAGAELDEYDAWWQAEGAAISAAVDRAGTPHLRMFDTLGRRVDEIQYPPEYWRLLKHGYKTGAVWRGFEQETALPPLLLGYVTSFYDPGLFCPYVVSMATAHIVDKYAENGLRQRFLPRLLAQDDSVWQGATWMTEARGGSDLGAAVETIARRDGETWRLTGDKYFCSNAGAELAIVAARPEGAAEGIRGLALFLVPRLREDGSLNYTIRRLKDKIATRAVPTGEVELRASEGYLMGEARDGIYLILEALNLSRTANSMGSVALAQRAIADALDFARHRVAFGKPLIEHSLMRRQFETRLADLRRAFALAWESALLANWTWRETVGAYSDTSLLFRLVTHLAKYWTADFAVDTARWAMEVYGGAGTLAENGIERWLREAMILDIWEGPPHRQILDGLEAMQRKNAHRLLFDHLLQYTDADTVRDLQARIDAHLALPGDEKEAGAEPLFRDLARFTASALEAKFDAARAREPAG
jgi:acyl-CoA dehydrogenase